MSKTTLDERLRTILTVTASDECIDKDYIDDKIAAIHAALKEDGYISPENFDEMIEKNADLNKRWGVMTGQEWYDHWKNYVAHNYDLRAPFTYVDAQESVMRAAGVDHD